MDYNFIAQVIYFLGVFVLGFITTNDLVEENKSNY